MSNNRLIDNGTLNPGDENEHQVQTNVLARSVAVKAPSSNSADILIGKKEGVSFPLSPGETITLDLKGASLFYKLGNVADKLNWITVSS